MFCYIKIILQQSNKNYFKKIHHQLFNNQSLELSLSSEFDNIIQEEDNIISRKTSQ